jgi:hypothetical protein
MTCAQVTTAASGVCKVRFVATCRFPHHCYNRALFIVYPIITGQPETMNVMTSIGVSNEAIHGNVAATKKAEGVDALVKETTKLSIASNDKEGAKPLAYTSEELQTICGHDHQGRSIFWIKVHEILPAEETAAVHWLAIHADDKSLREGITFSDSYI